MSIILEELQKIGNKPSKSITELAEIGTFLHNFYSGIENIINQIFISKSIDITDSHAWHKELLDNAVENKVITENLKLKLGKFLVFRSIRDGQEGYLNRSINISLPPFISKIFDNNKNANQHNSH